jgi:hypothetical protein
VGDKSELMQQFRSALFSRIVPTIKDIGLWGPKIRRAYSNMGIMGFAEIDTEALSARTSRWPGVRRSAWPADRVSARSGGRASASGGEPRGSAAERGDGVTPFST